MMLGGKIVFHNFRDILTWIVKQRHILEIKNAIIEENQFVFQSQDPDLSACLV